MIATQGCGFVVEEHVTGPYYILGAESYNDLEIAYRLKSGDYIGRIPAKVVEVGFDDSLLIGKSIDANSLPTYYIIDMNKDYDVAKEEEFLIDTMSEDEYRLNMKLVAIDLKKVTANRR